MPLLYRLLVSLFMWLLSAPLEVYGICPYCKVNQTRVIVSFDSLQRNETNTLAFKSSIGTEDETLRLQMQDDGNLVLVDLKGRKPVPIWASMKFTKQGDIADAVMLHNGLLVVYDFSQPSPRPIWSSTFDLATQTAQPYCVLVSSNPSRYGLSIVDSGCQVIWRAPLASSKKDTQELEEMWKDYSMASTIEKA
ncbi:hypothetical protein AC1031_002360 [Aphanomyces cochlioides]|nr:hypothetical protein AC1031_002360 [Aphanomyces cochlioides]